MEPQVSYRYKCVASNIVCLNTLTVSSPRADLRAPKHVAQLYYYKITNKQCCADCHILYIPVCTSAHSFIHLFIFVNYFSLAFRIQHNP